MALNSLGYVKKLEAAGVDRRIAEAHMEALSENVVAELATKQDLERAVDKLENKIDTSLWKHSVAIILAVLAVGGFLLRFAK